MGKREDILDATLDLVNEEGLQSTSFSKIFKRAGVGSGTVYHYFTNKEDLVSAVYIRAMDHLSDVTLGNYDPSQSVYDCFYRLMTNMRTFAFAYQKELWLLENYGHSPFIPEEVRNRENLSLNECTKLIHRGQDEGILRHINPNMCMHMVTSMLIAAVKGSLVGKYNLTDDAFENVIQMCWRAVTI